ncbi:MAG: hypothetical protein IKA36_07085 [Clostridia bacterium]|nr:hypothetical protein [Clostridia bacterium]
MANQQKNHGPDCWFAQQLANFGADFISGGKLNEQRVKRNIDRIISDIINARIDYNQYGYCILYPPVLDTLVAYCNDQLVIKQAIGFSLSYTMAQVSVGNIRCDLGVRADIINDQSSDNIIGTTMITEGTRRNIMVAINDNNAETNKYMCLAYYLNRVQITQNVYELAFIPNFLKPSNKRR